MKNGEKLYFSKCSAQLIAGWNIQHLPTVKMQPKTGLTPFPSFAVFPTATLILSIDKGHLK